MLYLKALSQELIRFKNLLCENRNRKFLERAEYMIIKGKQLLIIDRRINRNSSRFYRDYYKKKRWQTRGYQNLLSELYLDTEIFFYIASRLIDLFFDGMRGVVEVSKKERKRFHRIMTIRNELLEHNQKPGRPIEDEICQFGLNKSYGVYVRSFKGADAGRPYRDRAYYPLRNSFAKDLVEILKSSDNKLK